MRRSNRREFGDLAGTPSDDRFPPGLNCGARRFTRLSSVRILYIDIDSQRPDHFGCYGYHRNTSPAIDAIAREGVIFRRVYISDAPCVPSRSAFYSGRFGIQTGVVGHGGTAGQPKVQGPARGFHDAFYSFGLAPQLRKLGFHTAMISPFAERHSAWHIYAGFHEVHNTGQHGYESAGAIQPTVEKWLAEHAACDQWFLHVNYWDPHTPYRAPASYGEPFADAPLPAWLDDEELIARHNRLTGPHTSLDLNMYDDWENPAYPRNPGKIVDKAGMRRMIDGYDTAIRYMDDHIGRIIGQLKAAGVYEETAIIISADHGENFGELGIYGEHATADEATCRIPLIIKFPGAPGDRQIDGLCYHVDLAPTLMELLGGASPALWDGRSLAAAIWGDTFAGREDLVISQCSHVCQRSVRWDRWLYVRTYHCGFHLFPQEMLFDVENDPHEQVELAASRPELIWEGAWRLARWHDEQMERVALNANDVADPLWTVVREGGPFHARISRHTQEEPGGKTFHRYLSRLESTGRAADAEKLRAKYSHHFA